MNQLWGEVTFYEQRHNSLSDNMTSSKSAENLKSEQRGIVEMLYGQHFAKNQSPASSSTPNLSNSSGSRLMPLLRPLRKHFYLPEDKIHSSELVEKRQHFDKSNDKQDSSGISNSSDSVGGGRIGTTKNHDGEDSLPPFKGKLSSLSECDQKILQSSDSRTNDAIKINASSVAIEKSRIGAPTLIKSNHSTVCGGGSDLKCEGNEMDLTQQQHHDDASASTLDSGHHLRDLKPIKSLTTSQRQPNDRRQQHNLILMNDDCKLLQVQEDEQEASTSTSPVGTTCADKYCKNSLDDDGDDKNSCKINEISTTNSRINRKHHLNLDLYFDKELSAWLAERERSVVRQRQMVDNETKITNVDVGWKSCGKLSNISTSSSETIMSCDNSSNPPRHFIDSNSFSSSSTSATCTNSEIDVPLIDARRHAKADNGATNVVRSAIFTDGEFIYGPYDFDLFWNEFYQFRDGCDRLDDDRAANDDEAEKHENELLKNHDEVDNNAEVSFVRDVDSEGCEILRNDNNNNRSNNDRVDIEINVTNCSDDDEPDFTSSIRNDDVAFDRNFNYAPSDGRDRSLIDLMDGCDSYVSNNCRPRRARLYGDLHIVRPTTIATAAIYAENFDAPFIVALGGVLNNAQQFNYERDKIVEITEENEYLFASPPKVECNETCDGDAFDNDERQREFIVDGQRSDDDTKNKIRFKEHGESHRRPDSPQPHPSSSSEAKCDELDNCFCESKIDVGGGGR